MAPGSADRLQVALHTAAGEVRAQRVLDVTALGAGTRFARRGAPPCGVGDRVTLTVSSPEVPAPLRVEATVVSRLDSGSAREYGLRFERAGLRGRVPAHFHRLFNRRGAWRAAEPDPARPVAVEFSLPEEEHGRHLATARLKNISATGLAALTPARAAAALADCDLVMVSMRLPPRAAALRLAAWIRNRRAGGGEIHYGLLFDPRRTEDFLAQEEEIVEYVLARYEDALEHRLQ